MTPLRESDPLREQILAARRAQILEAAAQVFAEKGYHRATIRQVAETAGVADGTIYNYFENKADLLIGILKRLDEMEVSEEQLSSLSRADFRAAFLELMQRRLSLYLPNIDMFKAVLPEVLANADLRQLYLQGNVAPTLAALEEHLKARASDGHIREVDYELAARAMVAMLIGLVILSILDDPTLRDRASELPDTLATLLYEGLRPSAL